MPRKNAMTVDVEDYFQVSAFESQVARSDWDQTPTRVQENMARILAMFDEHRVKATFFTLGWVAEKHPAIVRDIVDNGHELASHGWQHTRANQQSAEEFREDVRRTRLFLEDLGGVEVKGYRAASYSIGRDNLWALDVLADEGYAYSSSIAPIAHDLYGIPDAPRFSFRAAQDRLTEIPVSTVRLLGRNVNCGGGGWFRLFPYNFSRWALNRVNKHDQQSTHFYFHPWEVDPKQPRVPNVSSKTRFRHYLNLSVMEERLHRLLSDFEWDRMDHVFADAIEGKVAIQSAEQFL